MKKAIVYVNIILSVVTIFVLFFVDDKYVPMGFVLLNAILYIYSLVDKKEQKDIVGKTDAVRNEILGGSLLLFKLNSDGKITYAKDVLCEILGKKRGEVEGIQLNQILKKSQENSKNIKDIASILKANGRWNGELVFEGNAGKQIYLRSTIFPISANKDLKEFLLVCYDITEYIDAKIELQKRVFENPLTGYANRQKLMHDEHCLSQKYDSALILISIASFGEINEFFGFDKGDEILIKVSNWIYRNLPGNNSLFYKLYSENFAVLVTQPFGEGQIKEYVDKINTLITKEKFNIGDDNEIDIRFTFGAAQGRKNLLKYANWALRHAKKDKKVLRIFRPGDMGQKTYEEETILHRMLKEALSSHGVIPYYQPIMNVRSGVIEKFETLMRIRQDNGEVISPSEFIEISKKTRLHPYLTREMMDNSFDIYNVSKADFSINISAEDILNSDISKSIMIAIKNSGFAHRIVFEILETEGISHYDEVLKFIETARSMGCKIAIDDFGDGYSNFEHLLWMNVDYVKLDQSIMGSIDRNPDTQIIVKSLVSFTRNMGIKTIAEFVHSESIFQKVKEFGIDYAQGNYIGEPKGELVNKPKFLGG